MNTSIARLCCLFIWNKKARHAFREKHINRKKETTQDFHKLTSQIENLNRSVNQIKTSINSIVSPRTVEPAQGLDRAVQLLGLEILQDVDRVCRKHNIRYWLDFGSLLGAIRHKGYIPWDDDVDISMLYDDFLKFKEVAALELQNSVACFPPGQWCKLAHKDFAPQTEEEWIIPFRSMKTSKIFIMMDIFPFHYLDESKTRDETIPYMINKCKEKFSLYDQEEKKSGRNFATWERVYHLFKNNESLLIADKPTDHMFMSLRWHWQSLPIFPPRVARTSDIFPLREIEFEGHKFMAPGKAELWMWCVYGDFWKLKVFPFHVHFTSVSLDEMNKLITHAKRLNCL